MGKLHKAENRNASGLLVFLTQIYVAVMLAGLPFFSGLGGYETTGEDTFRFFTATSTAYLGALCLGAVELVFTGSGRVSQIIAPLKRRSRTRLCFAAYLAWSALSAALSPYDGVWAGPGRYEGLFEILLCVLAFWTVSSYGRWDSRFLWLLGGVVLLNGALGLLQYAGANPLSLFPEGMNYHDGFVLYNGQFMGTLGNVDILGAFLCLAVPVFYAAYLLFGQPLVLLPLGAGMFLMALADVDAGYVGLAAALLLTFPVYYIQPPAWRRGLTAAGVLLTGLSLGKFFYADRNTALCLRLGWAAPALLGLLLMGAGLLLSRRDMEGPRIQRRFLWLEVFAVLLAGLAALYAFPFSSGTPWEIQQLLHGNFNAEFGSGRVRIWTEVLDLIRERPLLGGGPDTLLHRMTLTFTRYSQELGMTIESHVDAAHSLFLNTAVNQGLPALGFWLAGLGFWLAGVCKRRNTAGLLMLAGVAGYLVQGCFSVSLCSVTGLFWIFLALGECDIKPDEHKEEPMR